MPTPRPPSVWSVYLLRCADGTLYTGIAIDVKARLHLHSTGRGARYTRGRGPLTLVYAERAGSHGDALRRESAIRKLGRAGKEALVLAAEGRAVEDEGPSGAPAQRPKAPSKRARSKAISDPAARSSRS